MSLTDQPAAYADCYDLYSRAVASPSGVRAPFASSNAARHFQLRMHKARSIQRRQNCRAYPSGHPLYDTSEFDSFQVAIREDTEGEFWIYVQPHGIKLTHVEAIEEEHDHGTTETHELD